MFGIKSINTKRDHLAEMKSAISDAINTALKNGVRRLAIQHVLESHAADFRRAEEASIARRQYSTPVQRVATASGIKTIDPYAEQAKAEERRAARQLKADQAEYQRGLEEAAEREKWTR
jgi:hypothetical protein